MRLMFSPELVNEPFGDPGLYVDFRFDKRALLFDLGDIAALPPRKILRITDVFVSHAHMDHFCGFDRLLRICIGRARALRLYGPPGFAAQVAHKLGAYTWDLVANYPADFVLEVREFGEAGHAPGLRLRSRHGFAPEPLLPLTLPDGVLLDEPTLRVRAAVLDHGTPCLGFMLEEKTHFNIWRNRLAELGLPTGPWLQGLKAAVARDAPDDTPIRAAWRDAAGPQARTLPLGLLKAQVVRSAPGERIGYVTDVAFHAANAQRITALVAGATQLFIECVFLHEDAPHALHKHHLTARQAGEIARAAGARQVIPFHFSPRYSGRTDELRHEIDAAWRGTA